METAGHDSPVARIIEILQLPEEPMPSHESPGGSPVDESQFLPGMRKKPRSWTLAEDQRLIGAVARFGLNDWQMIAQWLGNDRNRSQCAQRWTRGLNPRISKKGWSVEEDRQLLNLVKRLGARSWTRIAAVLGNRSDVQCRYHFKQLEAALKSEPGFLPCNPPRQVAFMSLGCGRNFKSVPQMAPLDLESSLGKEFSVLRPRRAREADADGLDWFLMQFNAPNS
jgi:hypothetical protein